MFGPSVRGFCLSFLVRELTVRSLGSSEPAVPRVTPPRIRIAPEATRLTGSLDAEGYVFHAACHAQAKVGITLENNVYLLLWQAVGPTEGNVQTMHAVGDALGIPRLPVEGEYFARPYLPCGPRDFHRPLGRWPGAILLASTLVSGHVKQPCRRSLCGQNDLATFLVLTGRVLLVWTRSLVLSEMNVSAHSGTPARIAPLTLALVICDGCWRDPYTGKYTLIGTFSTITGEAFPLTHPILTVYIALTDGLGRVPIRLQLVDVNEEEEPLFVQEGQLEFPDPRVVCELVFVAEGLQFPHPGEYRLQLFAHQEFLLERRILVLGTQPVAPPPA